MIFEAEAVIRIICALVFGGLIGYEREYRNMPAGFRTHILVCIGSALVMITSEYMLTRFSGIVNLDPARLGAQVISGIGFLGAGTIIRDKFRVTGLTTAASLWAVACIGISVGIGFYYIATLSTIVIFSTLSLLRKFEGRLSCKVSKSRITVTANTGHEVDKKVISLIEEAGFEIKKVSSFKSNGEHITLKYEIQCSKKSSGLRQLIGKMIETDYIIGAEME